jgi:hypothetical protein
MSLINPESYKNISVIISGSKTLCLISRKPTKKKQQKCENRKNCTISTFTTA